MTSLNFVQFQSVFVDTQTGRLTREGFLFLQELWLRSGGLIAPTNNELAADLPEDAGIEEIKMDVFRVRDEISAQARIESLEALVNRMASDVEALKQGVIV